jgi:hypothetical protein
VYPDTLESTYTCGHYRISNHPATAPGTKNAHRAVVPTSASELRASDLPLALLLALALLVVVDVRLPVVLATLVVERDRRNEDREDVATHLLR